MVELRELVETLITVTAHVIVAAWNWYSSWQFRFHGIIAVILILLAAIFGPRAMRALRRGRRYKNGWISGVIRAERNRRTRLGWSSLVNNWKTSLAVPNAQTVGVATVFVLLSYPLQYLLSFAPLSKLFVSSESSMESLLGSLLQTHATVAGVALPLVVFLIERAKDEEETRLPASEVIMRESYIVPVTIFALFAGIKMGWDLVVSVARSSSVLVINTTMFSLTVLFTARALIWTLSLSFSRARLKERGLALVRLKAAASAEQSLHMRLAENALVRAAQELRIGFWLFGVDRDARDRFYVIEVRHRSRVADVNVVGLQELVESLPFKATGPRANAVTGSPEAAEDEVTDATTRQAKDLEKVFLARRIGEPLNERAGALLIIDKSSIESFDGVNSEYWVKRIFRLEDD